MKLLIKKTSVLVMAKTKNNNLKFIDFCAGIGCG